MKRGLVLPGFLVTSLLVADIKVAFNALPEAVQSSAKAEAKGAEIVGASKEVEKGRTSYEVETKVGGKSRDLSFDQSGKLLAIEEEVAFGTLPGRAQAAIRRRASGSAIKKVECVTQGTSVSYEAVVTSKSGRNSEISVNADGTANHD